MEHADSLTLYQVDVGYVEAEARFARIVREAGEWFDKHQEAE